MRRQEPHWWHKARELRDKDLTWAQIGKLLDRSARAARYAVEPEFRTYASGLNKRHYRRNHRKIKADVHRRYLKQKKHRNGAG